jgi:hypothetical protein
VYNKRRRSNCLFWAVAMFWRYGGYLAIRRVRYPIPFGWHWSWSPDRLNWLHYEPRHRMGTLLPAALHKIWFVGRIRRYDNEWGKPYTHPYIVWQRRRKRRHRAPPVMFDNDAYGYGCDDRMGSSTA